jgi:hypothetical protein
MWNTPKVHESKRRLSDRLNELSLAGMHRKENRCGSELSVRQAEMLDG